jgi:hypothetical protein
MHDPRGIHQLRTAPRSPWQNGYASVSSERSDARVVDHLIVLGQRHWLRCLRDYARYYNDDRPHLSLGGDSPTCSKTVSSSPSPELEDFITATPGPKHEPFRFSPRQLGP